MRTWSKEQRKGFRQEALSPLLPVFMLPAPALSYGGQVDVEREQHDQRERNLQHIWPPFFVPLISCVRSLNIATGVQSSHWHDCKSDRPGLDVRLDLFLSRSLVLESGRRCG